MEEVELHADFPSVISALSGAKRRQDWCSRHVMLCVFLSCVLAQLFYCFSLCFVLLMCSFPVEWCSESALRLGYTWSTIVRHSPQNIGSHSFIPVCYLLQWRGRNFTSLGNSSSMRVQKVVLHTIGYIINGMRTQAPQQSGELLHSLWRKWNPIPSTN